KEERLKVQQRAYEKQQEFIAKTEDFIRRNKHGQKHAQAEDRRKKLERIEPVELPRGIASPVMGFPEASRTSDVALRAEGVSKSYDQPLFSDLTFEVQRGERWGILGPNGSGKTTLLRCLIGEVELDAGEINFGTGVACGYYDQQLRELSDDQQVVEAVRPPGKEFNEMQRRGLLAKFGLQGDVVFQSIGSLSGGERSRAALSKLAAQDSNFLILDEPTNHLDLWARDALERSLDRFEGTVLFVSHDRYFLNQVADHMLVVEPSRFRVIEGNYETYQHFVKEGLAEATSRAEGADESSRESADSKRPAKKSKDAAKRKRRFPYRKVADLEADVLQSETRIEELQAALASQEVLRDGERVREVKTELAEQQQSLELLYAHWEEAVEMNS
ncbi:MAG: ATP-binding cassette domain-containing protein, partial [Planctomycetales bacterium]